MVKLVDQMQLKELVSITAQKLGIKFPFIIEKDYYVTYVIDLLSGTENEYFRLVFAGGTCLAKAHKIVKRMSEDVDFKIQFKHSQGHFSKSKLLKKLKQFRSLIINKLIVEGLTVTPAVVRNEGQYSRIEINYPSVYTVNPGLRSSILLEFTLSDIRLPVKNLSINTLIEDTLPNINLFASSSTDCISVNETAIEKWVGLTRRIVAIERNYHPADETLVRHIYDLNAIKNANHINADFFTLAKTIIDNDSKQFKTQHPEYAVNPKAEISKSLDLLKNKAIWESCYHNFLLNMVYDHSNAITYEKAISTIEEISLRVIENL